MFSASLDGTPARAVRAQNTTMNDMRWHIDIATLGDAGELAAFGRRTFEDAFGADNNPEDLRVHLEEAFGPAQQTRELNTPEMITLLARQPTGDRAIVAYAQVQPGQTPDCVHQPHAVELHRLYVDRPAHGSGLAQQLMVRVFEAARALHGEYLWLSVWERNPRGIAYYLKSGFVDVGTRDFFVGPDRQTDRVMLYRLVPSPQPG